jgi:hypothetical protein
MPILGLIFLLFELQNISWSVVVERKYYKSQCYPDCVFFPKIQIKGLLVYELTIINI